MLLAAAAIESSAASVWSAVFAGAAFLAAVVFGALNLHRARKGPDGAPAWTIEALDRSFYELRQTGTADATNVRITFDPEPVDVDGKLHHDVVHPGERNTLRIVLTEEMEQPRIQVTRAAAKRRRPDETWTSDLPFSS